MNVTDIARLAHEVNAAYCRSLNDFSQPPWEQAPEWQRASAIAGVEFHLQNPSSTPADSHQNWMKQKLDDGWTYGPKKDPALKQHPCMLPYIELPADQKAKDILFITVVRACRRYLDHEQAEPSALELGAEARRG